VRQRVEGAWCRTLGAESNAGLLERVLDPIGTVD
jgi:hypothetical protein